MNEFVYWAGLVIGSFIIGSAMPDNLPWWGYGLGGAGWGVLWMMAKVVLDARQ